MKTYESILDRKEVIDGQGWDQKTMIHLMEYFIEYNELGEEFTKYLVETARSENSEKDLLHDG